MTDKRLIPARADVAAAWLEGQVEAERFAEGRLHQVVAPSTHLRRAPASDAPLDTQLLYGETFSVYDVSGGFAWGQASLDGYVGYVSLDDLSPEVADSTHRVTALRTIVFSRPDLKSEPIAFLSHNAKLSLPREGEGRFRGLARGGWVYEGHVQPLAHKEADYVAVAEKYLGAPYYWGGRESSGLDCSALVQNALECAGVKAPRDSDLQASTLGEALAEPQYQRGDLVFWRGHVALMVDAEHVIHANATAMGVSRDSLQDFAMKVEADTGPITQVKRLVGIND